MIDSEKIEPILIDIGQRIKESGGETFIVGGWVRDQLLGITNTDYDVEVFGIDHEDLIKILKKYGFYKLIF